METEITRSADDKAGDPAELIVKLQSESESLMSQLKE